MDNTVEAYLHLVVMKNKIELAEEILQDNVCDVNSRDWKGYTVLHHAAKNNNVEMVKLLLTYGVGFDIGNNFGKTAKELTVCPDIIKLLDSIEKLFDDVRNVFTEKTVDIKIITHVRNSNNETLLLFAVKSKDCELDVIKWLVENGADINATD